MATHFIKALGIPVLSRTKQQIKIEDGFDVDIYTIGKLMVFIAQLWQCSEDMRNYLNHLAVSYSCPPLEIKI